MGADSERLFVNLRNNMIQKILIAVLSFVAGIVVYQIFLLSEQTVATESGDEVDYVRCPSEENFNEVWNYWSYEYINDNPDAGVDEQMGAWNTLMFQNGCGPEWFNPLSDLIEQHGASGTDVYWYHEEKGD